MKKSFFLATFIIHLGCVKEVQMQIPEIEPLPVVNSIFQTDSLIKVTLNKTKNILSNKPTSSIDNALILLSENDSVIDTLTYLGDKYISSSLPDIGKKYSLTINIDGFKTLNSSDKIPQIPILKKISFRDSVYTNSEGTFISQAEIVISDNPIEKNYYELILKLYYNEEEWKLLFSSDVEYSSTIDAFFDPETNDLVIENEGQLGLSTFKYPVFSDELFNGKTYTMRVNYGPIWVSSSNVEGDLVVILRGISKNYYDYKKSLTAHVEAQFSDIWDGVVEPSQMFTNIEGGYGIFAGYSQVSDTIAKK